MANNGDALETRRLFLQGADQVFARIGEAGGATAGTAWYLTDYQGTVQDIVSNAGEVLDQRTYDAFGNITSETDPAQGDRYGDDGGQLDPVTGRVQFGERDDDTNTGRFPTEDPSGLTAGANPFRIDGNDPTNATDPSGLNEIIHIPFTDPKTGARKEPLKFRWSGPFRTSDSYLGIYDPATGQVTRKLSDGGVYTADIETVNESTGRFSPPNDTWFRWYGKDMTPLDPQVTPPPGANWFQAMEAHGGMHKADRIEALGAASTLANVAVIWTTLGPSFVTSSGETVVLERFTHGSHTE